MIYLPEIGSTNMYAKRLIHDGLSAHGQVIWTHHQTQGQGQRSKLWQDEKGKSVLMSLILHKKINHLQAFQVNSLVTICVLNVLKTALPTLNFYIKWPNDIFVNDKKTCGILIENGWAGTVWKYAIVGIGINVLQENFSAETPLATSLKIESGISLSIPNLIENIKNEILNQLEQAQQNAGQWFELYNTFLYKKNQMVQLEYLESQKIISGEIIAVNIAGELLFQTSEKLEKITFGTVKWIL